MRILFSILLMLLTAQTSAVNYADPLGVQDALGLTPSTSVSTLYPRQLPLPHR